jgi:Domain of Unknown Function (DUF1080)
LLANEPAFTIDPVSSCYRWQLAVVGLIQGARLIMKTAAHQFAAIVASCGVVLVVAGLAVGGDESVWIDLIGKQGLEAWRKPTGAWIVAGDAQPQTEHPKQLAPLPGQGTLVNGTTGKTGNLLSTQEFGDVEAHFEFLIPKGSNSGVKFQTFYEIQIFDSFGVAKPTASHCGGIYPRAEMLPKYHHIDDGTPPRVNAARPPGEWQILDVIFRAPRFGPDGKKSKNARFERVVLNGQVIHEDVEVKTPTGNVWRLKEVARRPILLQGDHGPVAFRNIRVRPM